MVTSSSIRTPVKIPTRWWLGDMAGLVQWSLGNNDMSSTYPAIENNEDSSKCDPWLQMTMALTMHSAVVLMKMATAFDLCVLPFFF